MISDAQKFHIKCFSIFREFSLFFGVNPFIPHLNIIFLYEVFPTFLKMKRNFTIMNKIICIYLSSTPFHSQDHATQALLVKKKKADNAPLPLRVLDPNATPGAAGSSNPMIGSDTTVAALTASNLKKLPGMQQMQQMQELLRSQHEKAEGGTTGTGYPPGSARWAGSRSSVSSFYSSTAYSATSSQAELFKQRGMHVLLKYRTNKSSNNMDDFQYTEELTGSAHEMQRTNLVAKFLPELLGSSKKKSAMKAYANNHFEVINVMMVLGRALIWPTGNTNMLKGGKSKVSKVEKAYNEKKLQPVPVACCKCWVGKVRNSLTRTIVTFTVCSSRSGTSS